MIKKSLNNLRLHQKIQYSFLFTLAITLTMFIVTIGFIIKGYNNELYQQFFNTSNMLSSYMEKDFAQTEALSLSLIGDPSVQNYLYLNSSSDNMYEISKASNVMVKSLTGAFLNQRTVSSITVINSDGKPLTIGKQLSSDVTKHIGEITNMAYEAEGQHLWYYTDNPQGQIYSVRAIRNTADISLDHMGILIINYNLPKMVRSNTSLTGKETVYFLLSSDSCDTIYSTLSTPPFTADQTLTLQTIDNYAVEQIGGSPYFIHTRPVDSLNWYITTFFPLKELYRYNWRIIGILFCIFFLIILIQAYIAGKIARTITSPVEELVKNMDRVDNNDLTTDYLSQNDAYYRSEEIGLLYRNFDHMMHQIRVLIKENYEKQLILKEAQYQTLQAQINPHFLYNTLDSIDWLAKLNDQEEISRMIEALALLLRNTISTGAHLIPVEKELEILDGYLYLQKNRYEERLLYEIKIDEQAYDCLVPSLTLQILVENAIKHGPDSLVGPCIIHITAKTIDTDHVQFEVSDNGKGIPPETVEAILNGTYEAQGAGIGLKNLINRFRIDFGDDYTFQVESSADEGTTIRFSLPRGKGTEHV